MNGKKINKLIFITVLFAMGIFLTTENVMGQNWIPVSLPSDGSVIWYVDSNSIKKVSSISKRVWLKKITSPEIEMKSRDKHKFSTIGYSSFSHSLHFIEIDCVKKSYILLNAIDYDKSGNILQTTNFTARELTPFLLSVTILLLVDPK